MKKFFVCLLCFTLLLSLAACNGYSSSYSATMLVRSSGGESCRASWSTLKGTLVLNLSKKSGTPDSDIHFTASLDEGEMTVYYFVKNGSSEQKLELFTLRGGEKIDSRAGYVEPGDRVQIIIETNGMTEGGSVTVDF